MTLPQRHTPYASAADWFARRRLLTGRVPFPQRRWQQLGDGLTAGDPLADTLALWMTDNGMEQTHPLFQHALTKGLASLTQQQRSPELAAFFEQIETRPDWVEDDLLDLGRRVIDRCHPVPYYVLRNAALMAGYSWRDMNVPLLMTGALSGGTTRRVAQTMKWFSDCASPEGLGRNGAGFHSTTHVRLLHAIVRRRIAADDDWDHDDMGLPINQTDMTATWLAFSVLFLAGARVMGFFPTADEAHAVMHLWKYAAWVLGVDEALLTDDEMEGRILLFQILSTYRGPDQTSIELGRSLMDETAEIPYPGWRRWRQWSERAKHLSVTTTFVGPRGMRKLGLPRWVLPWYPAICVGPNLIRTLGWRVSPSWAASAERRGLIQREELVRLHFAGDAPDLAKG